MGRRQAGRVALPTPQDGEELAALVTQHMASRCSPAGHARSGDDWHVPVFPEDDYYIHPPGLDRGSSGAHRSNPSLSGEALINTLGADC